MGSWLNIWNLIHLGYLWPIFRVGHRPTFLWLVLGIPVLPHLLKQAFLALACHPNCHATCTGVAEQQFRHVAAVVQIAVPNLGVDAANKPFGTLGPTWAFILYDPASKFDVMLDASNIPVLAVVESEANWEVRPTKGHSSCSCKWLG